MDPPQLSRMANTFQSVLDASTLNARGDPRKFCQRPRRITPFRFGLSIMASMASKRVHSIADLPRAFNALWELKVSDKAFSKQRAKASGAAFLRTSLADLRGQLTRHVLGGRQGEAVSEFSRLSIQDGSSLAVHDALCQAFPGRLRTVKPAAVERHGPLDVLRAAPVTLVWSPDTDAEHAYRPEPASLSGAWFLADRGYLDVSYLREGDRHGGSCMVRAKEGLHPRVIDAFREAGQRVKACQERDLQASIAKWPKTQRVELDVEWLIDHQPFRLRLIVSGNTAKKCFVYLLTKLPPSRSNIEKICLGYKIRWHVALICKEWKAYAKLHAFDTANEYMTEALIWASLAAAALKRFFAPAAQHLLEVVRSPRKAARMPAYGLPALLRALRHGHGPWYRRAFAAMRSYLGANATRAHPQRDARTGRSPLGLKPVFALTDHKALMDSREERDAA